MGQANNTAAFVRMEEVSQSQANANYYQNPQMQY